MNALGVPSHIFREGEAAYFGIVSEGKGKEVGKGKGRGTVSCHIPRHLTHHLTHPRHTRHAISYKVQKNEIAT